jgi:hypothetical protein
MLPSVEVVWLLVEEVQLVVRGRAGYVDEDYRMERKRKKTSQWCGCSRGRVGEDELVEEMHDYYWRRLALVRL